MLRADWVEHVLATGGEAYLRTPEESLPLFVRLSLDVWAACLGAAAVVIYIALILAQLASAKLGNVITGRFVTLANSSSCSGGISGAPHSNGSTKKTS